MEGEALVHLLASVFAYILPPALLPLKSLWLWAVTDPWALGQQSQWLMLAGRSAVCREIQGSEDPVQPLRVRALTHPFRSFHPPHHTKQKIGYVMTCVKRLEGRMRPSETGAKGSFPSHRSWSADVGEQSLLADRMVSWSELMKWHRGSQLRWRPARTRSSAGVSNWAWETPGVRFWSLLVDIPPPQKDALSSSESVWNNCK